MKSEMVKCWNLLDIMWPGVVSCVTVPVTSNITDYTRSSRSTNECIQHARPATVTATPSLFPPHPSEKRHIAYPHMSLAAACA